MGWIQLAFSPSPPTDGLVPERLAPATQVGSLPHEHTLSLSILATLPSLFLRAEPLTLRLCSSHVSEPFRLLYVDETSSASPRPNWLPPQHPAPLTMPLVPWHLLQTIPSPLLLFSLSRGWVGNRCSEVLIDWLIDPSIDLIVHWDEKLCLRFGGFPWNFSELISHHGCLNEGVCISSRSGLTASWPVLFGAWCPGAVAGAHEASKYLGEMRECCISVTYIFIRDCL